MEFPTNEIESEQRILLAESEARKIEDVGSTRNEDPSS